MRIVSKPKLKLRDDALDFIDLYLSLGQRAENFLPRHIIDNLRSFTRLCHEEPDDPIIQEKEIDKQLLELKVSEEPLLYTWTPDGKFLLYGKLNGDVTELWRISVDGGTPEKMELEMKGLNHLIIHPDCKQIVFELSKEEHNELWKIDNLFTDSN